MSLRKNILTTYFTQIVSIGCSFISMILSTRMLGSSGQGELALYVNFGLLATLLTTIGLPSGIVHFIAAGKIEKRKLFSLLLTIGITGILLVFIFISLCTSFNFLTHLLPDFIQPSSRWIAVMLIHLFFMLSNSFLSAILQAEHQFKKNGYIMLSGSFIFLILYALKYFAEVFTLITPLKWIILSFLIGTGTQTILYLKAVRQSDKNYLRFSKLEFSLLKPLLQFASIAFATNLIQFLSYKMDIWFVNYFHGKEITGIYSLSVSLAQMVWLFPNAAQSVLYAFISNHHERKMQFAKTMELTRKIGFYAVFAGISGYILSRYLVPVFFGEQFIESIECIGILLLGIVPFCFTMSISGYFAGTGRVRYNLHSAILGFVVCLFADILLIPPFGYLGAAWASVISYLTTLTYLLICFKREQISI